MSRSGTSAPITRRSSLRESSIFFSGCARGIHVHDARENFAAGNLLNQFRGAARSQLRHFRIGAALEAIGSFAAQAESFGSAANGNGIEPGALDQNVARAEADFGFRRRPSRRRLPTARAASATTHISFVSVRSAPSSVRIFSPACARRTTMRCSCNFIEIECVQRVAELEHHVVRDVHHVVDRFFADGFQALAQPVGRRLHFHAAQSRGP